MSLAENLLNSLSNDNTSSQNIDEEPHIIVNESRQIIIPDQLKKIAVTGDKDVETVTIDCIRYWDEHDLSTFALYINYTLPNSDEGTYIPKNIKVGDKYITFTWTIGDEITVSSGKLTFSIEAEKTDDNGKILYKWGAFPNSDMDITKGLSRGKIGEEDVSVDFVTQVLQSLNEMSVDVDSKLSKDSISDSTGNSESLVMSQKATTREINNEISRATKRENEIESLFTIPTQDAVNKWLYEHPEATTTVLDKSLTYKKFVIGTLGYVFPEMFGAVGNGVTDDTQAFQNAIDSGCSVIVIPEKTYVVDGLTLRSNINICGFGTLIMCGIKENVEGNRYCILGDGITNVNIEGLTIEAKDRPTYLGKISNSTDVTFYNLKIDGKAWSDDLIANENGLANGLLFETSKNITVDNVYLKGVLLGKGVDFVGCENSTIENCKITHIGRGGIYITDNNNNCRVINNIVEYTVINFTVQDGAIDLYATNHNITVEGNYIKYFGSSSKEGCGIRIKSGTNNKAINNVIDITNNCSFCGILVQPRDADTSEVRIIGNKIRLENGKTKYYIRLEKANYTISDVIVSQNILSSNGTEFTATEALSLRTSMKNITVDKNRFFVDNEFNTTESTNYIYAQAIDTTRDNIHIRDNILVGGEIRIHNVNDGVIAGNIITSKNKNSRPLIIADCKNMFITSNVLKSTRKDITDGVYEMGTNTQLIKENIYVMITE